MFYRFHNAFIFMLTVFWTLFSFAFPDLLLHSFLKDQLKQLFSEMQASLVIYRPVCKIHGRLVAEFKMVFLLWRCIIGWIFNSIVDPKIFEEGVGGTP